LYEALSSSCHCGRDLFPGYGRRPRIEVRRNDARVVGSYNNGMAVFSIVKGGLMYDASLEGERFSFTPQRRG
jgi:hypothetical protein